MNSEWTTRAKAKGLTGRVKIIDAHIQRGWSSCDHMIDDAPANALIGRDFRCLADAMIAASKAEGKFSSAITVTLTDRSGATWKANTAPRIPGRDYCPLRECDPE